jgi:hypothetical protein
MKTYYIRSRLIKIEEQTRRVYIEQTNKRVLSRDSEPFNPLLVFSYTLDYTQLYYIVLYYVFGRHNRDPCVASAKVHCTITNIHIVNYTKVQYTIIGWNPKLIHCSITEANHKIQKNRLYASYNEATFYATEFCKIRPFLTKSILTLFWNIQMESAPRGLLLPMNAYARERHEQCDVCSILYIN